MNRKRAKYIVIPFIAIISGIFILNLVSKDKKESFSENRVLQQRPTIESVKSGTFTKDFEKYFSDQFIFREEILNGYNKVKASLGNSKIRSYYILKNNWIMPTPSKEFTEGEILEASDKVNNLYDIANNLDKEVYYISTPHKESMLKHLYPSNIGDASYALKNKNNFVKNLNKNIKVINIDEYFLKKFNSSERESLYFKTDHHWNGLGAFEGFKYIVETMGLENSVSWKDYVTTNFSSKYFLGSYNKNLNRLVKENELIPYVHLNEASDYQYFKSDGKTDVEIKEADVIATRINEDEVLYGGAYMFGNACSILKIKNDNAPVDKKILIIRDSYQAPTSWLFADLFAEVQLVDVRYTDSLNMSLEDIIRLSDANIVSFMYNDTDYKDMIKNIK